MSNPENSVQTNRTAIIVVTRGRSNIVNGLVAQLGEQSTPPDHIFVVATTLDDVLGLDRNQSNLTVHVGRSGSALQRNDGLALAGSQFSYIVFFDDDFVPSRFWIERMIDLFEWRPDIAGLTGTLLADGASTGGLGPDEAQTMVRQRDADSALGLVMNERVGHGSNVGCNMAFRYSMIRSLAFDEHLPAYAWLEDADFRGQVVRHGRVFQTDALWGVHLGHQQGRSRGLPLGYSQIANAVYLAKKGTVPTSYLAHLATRNLLSNAVRSLRPEPFVDRRGRLLGNIIALGDLIRGRIDPERILAL